MDLEAYFAMEGLGVYIWPAYAATAVMLTALLAYIVRRNARVRAELIRVEERTTLPHARRPHPRNPAQR